MEIKLCRFLRPNLGFKNLNGLPSLIQDRNFRGIDQWIHCDFVLQLCFHMQRSPCLHYWFWSLFSTATLRSWLKLKLLWGGFRAHVYSILNNWYVGIFKNIFQDKLINLTVYGLNFFFSILMMNCEKQAQAFTLSVYV